MQNIESILERDIISEDDFIVIRCDGKGFSKAIARAGIKLPYDKDFHKIMVTTTEKVLRMLFDKGFAYTFSDEVSFILPKENFVKYGRRIEKLLSLTAGAFSGIGSMEFNYLDLSPTIFDAKIFAFNNISDVMEYLNQRKTNCLRNFVFSVARDYYMKKGMNPNQIAKDVAGVKLKGLIERLLKENFDIYKLPIWQREGTIVFYESYMKKVKRGPIGSRQVEDIERRRLKNTKPLKFCPGDEQSIDDLINGEYKENK